MYPCQVGNWVVRILFQTPRMEVLRPGWLGRSWSIACLTALLESCEGGGVSGDDDGDDGGRWR
jgi:hypothetical protein